MRKGWRELTLSFCLVLPICVPLILPAQTKAAGNSRTIIVRGKWVWDGIGKPAIPGGVVLIRGDRIVAVGTEKEIDVPPDAIPIDHRDLFLMPGLVDCHNHFSMDQYAGVGGRRADDTVRRTLKPSFEAAGSKESTREIAENSRQTPASLN